MYSAFLFALVKLVRRLVTAAGAATTGTASAGLAFGAERVAATTARYRVGVVNSETVIYQAIDIIDSSVIYIHDAGGVNDELDTINFNSGIKLLRITFKGHAVLQP